MKKSRLEKFKLFLLNKIEEVESSYLDMDSRKHNYYDIFDDEIDDEFMQDPFHPVTVACIEYIQNDKAYINTKICMLITLATRVNDEDIIWKEIYRYYNMDEILTIKGIQNSCKYDPNLYLWMEHLFTFASDDAEIKVANTLLSYISKYKCS